MRVLFLLLLAFFVTTADATSPSDLEDATVIGTAPCRINNEQLVCLMVEKNNVKYAIAGYVQDDNFYARYVGQQTKNGWVTVWKYGATI